MRDGNPDIVHTCPARDIIAHDTDGDDCPCGPTVIPVERADGSMGWQMLHHSLDGRELKEEL